MVKTYSHNSLQSYRACPRQFSYRYIEKASVPKKVTADLYLGNSIHRSLERLYSTAARGSLISKSDIIKYYLDQWEKPDRLNISVTNEYISVDDYIERGRKMLEIFYNRFQPFDQGTLLGAEMRIRFRLKDTPFEFTSIIDKLWKRDDGVIEICDYKTGMTLPQGGRDPRFLQQMGLYQLAVQDKFPNFEQIELVQNFLGLDEIISHKISSDELDVLREELRVTVVEIKESQRLESFPTSEGSHCGFCDYQKLCPAKRHRVQLDKESGGDGKEISSAEYARDLAEKYLQLDFEFKSMKSEISSLKEELVKVVGDLKVDRLYGKEGSIKIALGSEERFVTKSNDTEQFAELAAVARQLELDDYFELNTKLLMKEVYRKQMLSKEKLDKLDEFVSLFPTSRITVSRKKKLGQETEE